MINKKMDSSDDWKTSTPLQCRHDSGYESYPKHYGLLVLSPIRKQVSVMQGVTSLGKSDKISPRRLNLSELFSGKNINNSADDSGFASSVNSTYDSGISSSFDESISEHGDLIVKKTSQYVLDENCNFISLLTAGKEYQPLKYICKDHSHETEGKCNRNSNASKKIFRSYAISSEIFLKQKNSKIDFLYELDIRNCSSIISDILSYLSDEDLRQANNVSKKWQDIVSSDRSANSRRASYINNKKNAAHGPNKENNNEIATPVERNHKSAFTSLANFDNDTKQPLIFENSTQGRFDSFIQELKSDGIQQTLVKCPKCRYPARADIEFKYCCSRKLCKHEFCRKCLGPFLDNHKCSVSELNDSQPSIIVGSKKSRKNLRRLKA